ncbi:MAG: Uma2 family endonuclease [Armatimonadota bacterium]
MAVQTVPKTLTYEEWLQMPETNQPCKIVDGEVKMSPAPSRMHQRLIRRWLSLLEEHVPETRGELLPSPVDVTISRSPLKVCQPDVMVELYKEGGYQNAQQLLAAPHGDVVPDLVVEVLSPSETQSAVDAKIEDYRQVGVRELWLVSPEAETGEVLKLSSEGAERVGLYGRGDVVRSDLLPELHIDTNRLFA